MVGWYHRLNGHEFEQLGEILKDREAWCAAAHRDADNHDGVITHLELDILECEVKCALGSIPTNKTSGGDGIPGELFQML